MNRYQILIRELIANWRAEQVRVAFAKFLNSDPQHAIEHANGAFDEANRAEYEQLPVTL